MNFENGQPSAVLAGSLLVLSVMIGGWDIYLGYQHRYDDTVSAIMQKWSLTFPVLPFMLGMLAGHIFWPRMPNIPK